MTTPNPDELPDDIAAAIKAADDYADTLNQLKRHDLPKPMLAWLGSRLDQANDDTHTLRNAARTLGNLT